MMAKCAEKGSGLWSIWNMHDMITIWTTNDMSKCRAIEANMYSKQTITNEQQQQYDIIITSNERTNERTTKTIATTNGDDFIIIILFCFVYENYL